MTSGVLSWDGPSDRIGAWLRRNNQEDFTVYSSKCTHLGCPVRWIASAELFMCPCHGGVYFKNGDVAAGPPPVPLQQFAARVANGRVQVQWKVEQVKYVKAGSFRLDSMITAKMVTGKMTAAKVRMYKWRVCSMMRSRGSKAEPVSSRSSSHYSSTPYRSKANGLMFLVRRHCFPLCCKWSRAWSWLLCLSLPRTAPFRASATFKMTLCLDTLFAVCTIRRIRNVHVHRHSHAPGFPLRVLQISARSQLAFRSGLLILTLAMGFTGQLMRWDQNAVWSVNIAAKHSSPHSIYRGIHVPPDLRWRSLEPGLTLTRFFDLHVFVIPATIMAIIGFHLYLVLYNGISEPPKAGAPVNPETYKAQYKQLLSKEGVPFWPDAAWRDALFGSLVIAACITFAVMIGAPKLVPPQTPVCCAQTRVPIGICCGTSRCWH